MPEKIHVKHIEIASKIRIAKSDVESENDLLTAYSYHVGDEILSTMEEDDEYFYVPSNSYSKLSWDTIEDHRNFEVLPYQLTHDAALREEQQEVIDKFTARGRARSGIIKAPCGWGKTFTGCSLIAKNNTKTLILVHTKLLFNQWVDELEQQLPDIKIGKIGSGFDDLQDITVAIYKSAVNRLDKIRNEFSLLIVDECHLCPANMFSNVVNNINCKIKIGFSATPKRKDGKHVFLSDFFTDFMIVGKEGRIMATPSVRIVPTDFSFVVHDPKTEWARAVNKLCENTDYIKFIAKLANDEISRGRVPLILSDRVQMLRELEKLIDSSICLIGETEDAEREVILKEVGTTYKAILTTKIFDEGISCHRLDTLIPTCPHNNPMKLEQRIGRIIREHPDSKLPLIIDIQLKGNIVSRQQKSRKLWYARQCYNIL